MTVTYEERLRKLQAQFERNNDRGFRRLLGFLKAPCKPEDCVKHLKYRHFTCLTCPPRRYREQGVDSGYRKVKRMVVVLESASGRGIVVPKHYRSYGLIIKTRDDGSVPAWKKIPIKILCTVAERIAEW